MQKSDRIPRKIIQIFLAIAVAGGSLIFFQLKYYGLHFHTRDFPFYATKYICLLQEEKCGDVLNLNPVGRNFLGFAGIDGYPKLENDIHFSPITWVISEFYQLFPSLLAMQILWAVAAGTLVLLLYRIAGQRFSSRTAFVFVLLFIAIPSFPHWATYDLRVYSLFGAVLIYVCYALTIKSPLQVVLGCILLSLVREEALIFIVIATMWLIILREKYKIFLALYNSILFLIVLVYLFGQEFELESWTFIVTIAFAIIIVDLLAATPTLVPESFAQWARQRRLALVPATLAFPFLFELWPRLYRLDAGAVFHGLFLEAHFLVFVALIFISLVFSFSKATVGRKKKTIFYGSALLFFLTMSTIFWVRNWPIFTIDRSYVHKVAQQIRRDGGNVLTDYLTYQAFLGYQNAYVFLRIPDHIFARDELSKSCPQNGSRLPRVIDCWANVIISERKTFGKIDHLIKESWRDPSLIDCGETVIVIRQSTTLAKDVAEICGKNANGTLGM